MDKNQFDQATPAGDHATQGAVLRDQDRLNARRRLLKGGLGLAPVTLTMASRPVLAGTETCHGPTGFQSAPPSRIGKTPSCSLSKGSGPTAWSGIASSAYPDGCAGRLFSVAFNDSGLFANLTLYKAIRNDFSAYPTAGATDKDMARKAAAAYLNSISGKTFPMSTLQVQQLWQGYVRKSYQPGGTGVKWTSATQFQSYLNYVMTA